MFSSYVANSPTCFSTSQMPSLESLCSSYGNVFEFFFYLAQQPPVGQGLLIHEISRSHTTTHHNLWDSSGRVISPSQRPLPDNTQHSQQRDIHAPAGIRTHNPSRRTATNRRLRPPTRTGFSNGPLQILNILKTTLKSRRFQTIEEIQENAIRELRAIRESAFQETFQQWNKRWERCIASRGDYFEGDGA